MLNLEKRKLSDEMYNKVRKNILHKHLYLPIIKKDEVGIIINRVKGELIGRIVDIKTNGDVYITNSKSLEEIIINIAYLNSLIIKNKWLLS